MKRFTDLTLGQQDRAIQEALYRIAEAAAEGGLRFNDAANGNKLQERIDELRAQSAPGGCAEALDLPHRIQTNCYLLLLGLAEQTARCAVYLEGETAISVEDL